MMVVESETCCDVGMFELQSNVDFSIPPLLDTENEHIMVNGLTCMARPGVQRRLTLKTFMATWQSSRSV